MTSNDGEPQDKEPAELEDDAAVASEPAGRPSGRIFNLVAGLPPEAFGHKSAVQQGLSAHSAAFASSGYRRRLEQIQLAVSPELARLARSQVRLADSVTPAVLRGIELSATSQIADLLGSGTALAAWRKSLLMDETVQRLVRSQVSLSISVANSELLEHLGRISAASVGLTEWAAAAAPGSTILRGISSPSIAAYRGYVAALPAAPSRPQLELSLAAGHGVGALVGAELLTGELDEEQDTDGAERVEQEIVAPWQEAPYAARAELLVVLGEVDPAIPELIAGAWDDVARQGPAALVKIATCTVEALDRSLRAVVPKDGAEVLAWLEARNRSGLIREGRATRAGQIRYHLRNRAGDAKLVERQVDSVVAIANELVGRIQAAKHASEGDVTCIRAHLVAVEAVLHQLFLVGR